MSLEQDVERWELAQSLADLGELTAEWLEGRVSWCPLEGGLAGPAEETTPLIPVLASLNRAGFVTDFSQPGEMVTVDGTVCRQRAAVSGFCDGALLERLIAAAPRVEGLRLIVHTADVRGTPDGAGVVVTTEGTEEFTWAGRWMDRALVAQQWWRTSALGAVWGAWQVAVVDLEWGRNDVLWPLLESVAEQGGGE